MGLNQIEEKNKELRLYEKLSVNVFSEHDIE